MNAKKITTTVKWYNPEKGYGFLLNPDGPDIFVHQSVIAMDGRRFLTDGEPVECTFEVTGGGRVRAVWCRKVNTGATPPPGHTR